MRRQRFCFDSTMSLAYVCGRAKEKRTPRMYQGPVLWVCLDIFSPLHGTSFKTTH